MIPATHCHFPQKSYHQCCGKISRLNYPSADRGTSLAMAYPALLTLSLMKCGISRGKVRRPFKEAWEILCGRLISFLSLYASRLFYYDYEKKIIWGNNRSWRDPGLAMVWRRVNIVCLWKNKMTTWRRRWKHGIVSVVESPCYGLVFVQLYYGCVLT